MRRVDLWSAKRGWLLGAAVLLVAMLLQPGIAWGGAIEIHSSTTRLQGGVWYLDADIRYRLNETALEALDSGLALDVELTIRLTQRRRLIWDPQFAELKQRYELQYHALTERYILRNLNSGEHTTYSSLPGALLALGTVRSLPIIDDALLSRGERYHVSMRAVVDIKQLGGPLAMIRFLWNDWRITGEWERWRLEH
jgi:hypothetical protein